MAFLFMHFSSRAATSTNCSTNVLLNTSLHATSCTATTLWPSSHDLRPSARSHLIHPLSINNLLCLSPNKLGMDIYLINQITSAALNSNNIICDTFMRLSKLLSSPMGWRFKRPRLGEATILSLFQPPGYISRPISARSFNIDPASAPTTSPLKVFTSACCLLYWMCYSQYSRLCSRRYCSQRSRHCPQVHHQFHLNILVVVIYIAHFVAIVIVSLILAVGLAWLAAVLCLTLEQWLCLRLFHPC